MSAHSVGVTKNVHKELQRIRMEYNLTMSGFAIFALKSILKSKRQIEKIVNEIEHVGLPTFGSKRLQDLDY